ncbi:MAG: hypothetical protein ACOYL5_06555 [Phototrophicaceae bacterium]|jgi:hypothetical protein
MTVIAHKRLYRLSQVFFLLLAAIPPLWVVLMIRAYWMSQFPHGDEWRLGIYWAQELKSGQLDFNDLFISYNGHRHPWWGALVVTQIVLVDWDFRVGGMLNVALALLYWGGMMRWVWRTYPALRGVSAAVLSVLIFAPASAELWIDGINGIWLLSQAWLVGGLWALTAHERTPMNFCLALLCAIGLTFSNAAGIVGWGILLVVMWLAGYRHTGYVLVWVVTALVVVGLYFAAPFWATYTYTPPESVLGEGNGFTDYRTMPHLIVLGYAVFLSAPIIKLGLVENTLITLWGMALLVVNSVLVLRAKLILWRHSLFWMGLAAYGGAAGLLVIAVRIGIYPPDQLIYIADQGRYHPMAAGFWMTVLFMTTVWVIQPHTEPTWKGRVWLWVNVSSVVLILTTLCLNALWFTGRVIQAYPQGVTLAPYLNASSDACFYSLALHLDESCLQRQFDTIAPPPAEYVYRATLVQVGGFRNFAPALLLPNDYQPNEPIIVLTDNAWLALVLRDFYLRNVPAAEQWHFSQPSRFSTLDGLSLDRLYIDGTFADVRPALEGAPIIWVLVQPEAATVADGVLQGLADEGYSAQPFALAAPYTDARYDLYQLRR